MQTFIFAKCGDLELAEDLAQEAFIRYWQNFMTIEPQKARSFLFTVSNNLFLDNIRHAKVKNNYSKAFQQVCNNQDPQYLIEMEEKRKAKQLKKEARHASKIKTADGCNEKLYGQTHRNNF